MARPTRYYVEYPDRALEQRELERIMAESPVLNKAEAASHLDPAFYYECKDFEVLAAAQRFAKPNAGLVYERQDIRDVTPDEDWTLGFRGLLWDWDEEIIDEHSH